MKTGKDIRSYRDLLAWQKGMELCGLVYRATARFPQEETFGLRQQSRRAAVSVPANIAEGWGRGSLGDYLRFLRNARGSLCELETEMLLAVGLGYLGKPETDELVMCVDECSRILQGLIASLKRTQEG